MSDPTTAHPATETRIRSIAYALGLDGLSADPSNAENYAAYLELIAPGETPFRAAEMARDSDCGLVAAGILRFVLGQVPSQLRAPYKVQMALDNLRNAALAAGAVRTVRDVVSGQYEPSGGDIAHVGANGSACEHVYTITRYDSGDVDSIDGGQRTDDGHRYELVSAKRRTILNGYDTLDNGTRRPLIEVYDLDALAAYYA